MIYQIFYTCYAINTRVYETHFRIAVHGSYNNSGYSLVTECLRANGLDEPLLCPDTDMSDPMLSDDCSLTAAEAEAEAPATEVAEEAEAATAAALWCSVSEDPVSVDTGLPLLDTGLEGPPPLLPVVMAVGESSANGRHPLSRDNSSPSRVYSVSELQLLRFDVDDPPRGLAPVSSSARNTRDTNTTVQNTECPRRR